ncbi:MAG: SDR family NAD(P)-dependent oxidoreductase [Caldisphaera sp.]
MYSIINRIAVVTSSGIGREIALEVSKNGANVIVNVKKRVENGNQTFEDIKKYSSGIMVQADVSTVEVCKKLQKETLDNLGKCDILVNNAGISIAKPFLENDDMLIDKTTNTNLMSTIYCSKEFGREMRDGTIVNILSIAGIKPMNFIPIYGITKAAVISLTKYLAIELSENNVRVNAVALSVVKTVMGESLLNILNLKDKEYIWKYTLTNVIS